MIPTGSCRKRVLVALSVVVAIGIVAGFCVDLGGCPASPCPTDRCPYSVFGLLVGSFAGWWIGIRKDGEAARQHGPPRAGLPPVREV